MVIDFSSRYSTEFNKKKCLLSESQKENTKMWKSCTSVVVPQHWRIAFGQEK